MSNLQVTLSSYVGKRVKGNCVPENDEKILATLKLFPVGSPPDLESLYKYLRNQQTINNKIVLTFLSLYDKINQNDPDMVQIISCILGSEYDFKKTLAIIESKGYILGQQHLDSYLAKYANKSSQSDLSSLTHLCNIINYFITNQKATVDSVIRFLLFDDDFHYNKNATKWEPIILDILNRCNITISPTQDMLVDAYHKYLQVTVEILQNKYSLKPDVACLKAVVDKKSSGRGLLKDLIKSHKIKPDASDMYHIMEFSHCDEYIQCMRENNLLDLNIHGKAITDKFGNISSIDLIKHLIKSGFVLTQKCLESSCLKSGNIHIIRFLVETHDIRVTTTCVENACSARSNANTISYLLEKCDDPPSSKCLLNRAKASNDNILSMLLEKYFKINGSEDYLKPIYDEN